MKRTPGEAAYRKFRELTYTPEENPITVPWHELTAHGKTGWEEIAKAAIRMSMGCHHDD